MNQAREALVAKIGENMNVRRFERFATAGHLAAYRHGVRIGVVVDMRAVTKTWQGHRHARSCQQSGGGGRGDVPAEALDKEREIFQAQAAESGKPANIVEKMVEGRVRKYLAEVTLLGQPFVKDPDTHGREAAGGEGAKVHGFRRFEVGEGIEKRIENFAEEVMAQVQGA